MNRHYIITALCRSIIIVLLLLILPSVVYSQNSLKLMNNIKLSPDKYIYSQSIHTVADSALTTATILLWRESNTGETDTISIEELKHCMRNIVSTHDKQTRQFVYASRAELDSVRKMHHLSKKTIGEGSQLPLSPFAAQIMDMPDLKAVYDFLKLESDNGHISGFGPLQNASALAESHIVICDAISLKPIVILSAEDNKGQRISLQTGQPDSMDNYHGTYMLWYKHQ